MDELGIKQLQIIYLHLRNWKSIEYILAAGKRKTVSVRFKKLVIF